LSIYHLLYGLTISANVPLPGILVQSAESHPPPADVSVRLRENPDFLSPGCDPPQHPLYISPNCDVGGEPSLRVGMIDNGGYWGLFYRDGARFAVSHEGNEIWAEWPQNYKLEDACTYLVGPVIALVLRLRGFTCIHASSIALGGWAVALVGGPGAGKSTTAAAFGRLGYPVVSDDVVVLSSRENRFLVQPGYPRLNLWPDSVRALFGSTCVLPNIATSWEKKYLALDQNDYRFQPEALPLGPIYILGDRDPELACPTIEELGGSMALTSLVANTYGHYLLDSEMQRNDFDLLGQVVARVPVCRVRPTADPSKLVSLCDAILADAKKFIACDRDN
jgi:hypothetical protein